MAAADPFAAGAGVDPAALKAAAAVSADAAVLLWAAWVSLGLYSRWRAGAAGAMDLAAGAARAVVVALLVVYFMQ